MEDPLARSRVPTTAPMKATGAQGWGTCGLEREQAELLLCVGALLSVIVPCLAPPRI